MSDVMNEVTGDVMASLLCEGPEALTDEALFEILLGSPEAAESARAIVRRFPDHVRLRRATFEDLCEIPGIDPRRAAALQAAVELGRRVSARPWRRGERFRSSRDVSRALGPRLRDLRREIFLVLLLDGRNRKIGEVRVSEGSLSASIVHPREVFLPAIRASAASILVVHNHPSGDSRPSAEDREVTWRLGRAGELLGIRLLDHVILGEASYYSFAEEGMMAEGGPPGALPGASGYGGGRPKRR
ncbi:MAG: DNA repair protein RadC [Deltaproteobacteria bacterium]|nr:DNA repair protein RadC [Deltaproteobacteria bacterium]